MFRRNFTDDELQKEWAKMDVKDRHKISMDKLDVFEKEFQGDPHQYEKARAKHKEWLNKMWKNYE